MWRGRAGERGKRERREPGCSPPGREMETQVACPHSPEWALKEGPTAENLTFGPHVAIEVQTRK